MTDPSDLPKALRWGGFDRLTSLPEALVALARCCEPVASQWARLDDAVGRIAAAPVCTPAPLPPVAAALRDGWAVAAADTVGASSAAPCFAAAPPIRLAFGDPVPRGFDAMLPLHSVAGEPRALQILETIAPGEGLRLPGSDFTAGEAIVKEGEALRADRVALLRLAGLDAAPVRFPRIAIVAGGATGEWLASAAREEGAQGHVIDPGEDLSAWTKQAPPDFIIAVGNEAASGFAALSPSGFAFSHGVALRPGQTICGAVFLQGARSPVPFVLAPDRIEYVLAAWFLLVRPCLRRLAGAVGVRSGESLPLTRKLVSIPGWTDLAVLRRSKIDGSDAWEPLACADIPWSAIARADAWLAIEANCEGFPSGQVIFAELL